MMDETDNSPIVGARKIIRHVSEIWLICTGDYDGLVLIFFFQC